MNLDRPGPAVSKVIPVPVNLLSYNSSLSSWMTLLDPALQLLRGCSMLAHKSLPLALLLFALWSGKTGERQFSASTFV